MENRATPWWPSPHRQRHVDKLTIKSCPDDVMPPAALQCGVCLPTFMTLNLTCKSLLRLETCFSRDVGYLSPVDCCASFTATGTWIMGQEQHSPDNFKYLDLQDFVICHLPC